MQFDLSAGQPGVCREKSCAAPVVWIVTAAGKRMPCNADGTSHFATCPAAVRFRKKRGAA